MNLRQTIIAGIAVLGCVFGTGAAWADRDHGGHGRDHADHDRRGGWDGRGGFRGSRGDWGVRFSYVRPRFGPTYRFEWDSWRGGHWYHSWHNGVYAWWWVIGDDWFDYPAPIYPYPYPTYYYYDPVYDEGPPPYSYNPAPPQQIGPPPQQSWYYCGSPKGYYPYVSSCPGGWRAVPATPPGNIRGQ